MAASGGASNAVADATGTRVGDNAMKVAVVSRQVVVAAAWIGVAKLDRRNTSVIRPSSAGEWSQGGGTGPRHGTAILPVQARRSVRGEGAPGDHKELAPQRRHRARERFRHT